MDHYSRTSVNIFMANVGHAGSHSTLHTIAHCFLWANMSKTVQTYVARRAACQAANGAIRLSGGVSEPHDRPADPGAHWTMDCIVMPRPANGSTNLLVCADRFGVLVANLLVCADQFGVLVTKLLVCTDWVSKLVVLGPMKETSALKVAKALVDHVFCCFGVPQSLCSDRVLLFHSAVFTQIFRLLGSSVKLVHLTHGISLLLFFWKRTSMAGCCGAALNFLRSTLLGVCGIFPNASAGSAGYGGAGAGQADRAARCHLRPH